MACGKNRLDERKRGDTLMYRVEDKYYLPLTDMWELEKRISLFLKPDPYNIEGKGYKISSLYFDDYCDSCLQGTVDGIPERDKYRIRIYNDSFDIIKLEIKSKLYNRTLKRGAVISKEEFNKLISNHVEDIDVVGESYDAKELFVAQMKMIGLKPKAIVTYDRNAYIYDAGNVRITFDYNLRGSNNTEQFGRENILYDKPDGMDSVLEVKYDEFLPDFIAQLLESNNMLQSSNSKYRIIREIYK